MFTPSLICLMTHNLNDGFYQAIEYKVIEKTGIGDSPSMPVFKMIAPPPRADTAINKSCDEYSNYVTTRQMT